MNSLPSIWTRVSARAAREYSELASQAFLDAGCQGVQIDDVRLEDRGEDAAFIETPEVVISSYLEGENKEIAEHLRAALREYSVPAKVETEIIDAPDWSVSWRENFPILEIGKWTIAPTWETLENTPDGNKPNENQFVIRLDPGLAFGTGQHPTTRMCLELIGERAALFQKARVLDIGCGSGVLSIAAARLGAQVTASDLDPHCIEATRENAALNDVEIETVEVANLDWVRRSFPIVVANLMSDLLISLAPELSRVAGSTLIVSGISSPRADDVETALKNVGFSCIEKREQDGELRGEIQECWAAFVFEKI